MIVVMKPEAGKQNIQHVVDLIEELGLRSHVIVGTDRTVIAALGEKRDGAKQALENAVGVEKVVPILAPYKMASTEVKTEPTTVKARMLEVKRGQVAVIAGPCSVESREQILQVAEMVREAGATGLRGGAFKPRTSPYSFQGLKEKGLELLAEAREKTGLAVVTEVMASEHVPLVAKYADVMQVGARNMQNYPLLEAVGESGLPIMLKRGPAATMDEFLLAAEYILKSGNTQVMLCERGIRTFEDHTRFTLPLASVPYLQQTTHLPVIVDPSHGTGKSSLVAPMAAAAIAAGADGLIVEVHPDPEKALSDGYQALSPPAFKAMMATCRKIATAMGKKMG
ncbi:MAG TPA: 3-deoxy-7-phosphoheptulonate synthase [Gemmataceae bacterium]|jgi:3-deoxy-7-phosphoheptulonate synthase|nr:3-deoxy-7-phosphoheptulonate synthase [Gemmataceae bacterium]